MTTIYDVAKAAGVSPATVSRVYNGVRVSPDLQAAVQEAAHRLDFVPNRSARRLRMQSSELIAMIIPDIENPFFTTMTRAVEDVARAARYSVVLCNTDEDPAREAGYLRAMVSEGVAGIICAPTSQSTNLEFAVGRGVPVVCVDRTVASPSLDAVVVDNERCAADAVDILYGQGYSRIGCITGPEGVETADLRAAGYRAAVKGHWGKLPRRHLLKRVPYTVEGGEQAMRELLSAPQAPDAIVAANNKLAAGAIRVLFEQGLTTPHVGLVALGGLPIMTYAPRGVTVLSLPARALGTRSASMLLERIQGWQGPGRREVLDHIVTDDQAAVALLHDRRAELRQHRRPTPGRRAVPMSEVRA